VQSVLDLARRELAAAQDENKILRGELAGMEDRFAHDRSFAISDKEHIQTLEVFLPPGFHFCLPRFLCHNLFRVNSQGHP
jgi:hypothetical protein